MTASAAKADAAATVTLNVTDRKGARHALTVGTRGTLMEALRDNGMDVAAICGGCCSCGTCHVYITAAAAHGIGAPDDNELELLEMQTAFRPTSRLSCQIPLAQALDGLTLDVAPEF
jgi:2Fe-2S ferredoxin